MSCQSCTYGSDLNKGLTGYVANGANKAITLLDVNKRIITRRIVRLRVFEDENVAKFPAIYVEESTQFGSKGIDKIYAALDILSQRTGLPVIASTHRPSTTEKVQSGENKIYKIIINRGRSRFDYSDSYGGSIYQNEEKMVTNPLNVAVKPADQRTEKEILQEYRIFDH